MITYQSTPCINTKIVGMTTDEHEMLTTALKYTLQQVRYDPKKDRYHLDLTSPKGDIKTVMLPEEFNVLEEIAFRVIGDASGGYDNE